MRAVAHLVVLVAHWSAQWRVICLPHHTTPHHGGTGLDLRGHSRRVLLGRVQQHEHCSRHQGRLLACLNLSSRIYFMLSYFIIQSAPVMTLDEVRNILTSAPGTVIEYASVSGVVAPVSSTLRSFIADSPVQAVVGILFRVCDCH
jgi:hypothetical protein